VREISSIGGEKKELINGRSLTPRGTQIKDLCGREGARGVGLERSTRLREKPGGASMSDEVSEVVRDPLKKTPRVKSYCRESITNPKKRWF